MSEARSFGLANPTLFGKESVCIDTMRILDSCRDKDCYEDARVFLTDFGLDTVEKATSLRVKDTQVVCCNMSVDPVQFNRGFYQVGVKFYTKITIEACLCVGKTQEVEGIAVTEKKVVLFGGEGNVRVFKSNPAGDFCSPCSEPDNESKDPAVVVEVVDPIALSVKVVDCPRHCRRGVAELPERVFRSVNGSLCDYGPDNKELCVTLGFFSIIRIERPSQLVVSAGEYCVPDKECPMSENEDPCKVFSRMAFPVSEFCPTTVPDVRPVQSRCECGKKQP